MCSTQKEQARLKWGGFNTLWCHQNLFCNEDELKYSGSSERIYDAVYTAVFAPYKRHDLLTGVENLRLITGSTDKLANLPKMGLPNVTVNDRYLTKSEVSEILSQCKCGLALSQEEGGMLASTEYLLSGLPVVSTPSIGGRDIYYQKGNHILCDPTVDAVTQAVERAARQDWDRKAIRDHAIEKSKEFRFQLAECVQGMTGTYPFDAREITGSWFTKKFLAIHFMKDFFDSHCGNYFEREDLIGKFA
jgi:glycosyltransferase involved in cell wall biosynthesis